MSLYDENAYEQCLKQDSFTIALPLRSDPRVQCSFWQVHFFGDGLYRRASQLLYAFKKRISEGCVGIFSGHKSPLSAPFLGNESGHFDLRKGVFARVMPLLSLVCKRSG